MRSQQRGGIVVAAIFWLIVAGIVSAAVYGAYRFVVNIGVHEEQKRLAPLIAKCDAQNGTPESCAFDWTTAVAQRAQAVEANKTLNASVNGPGGLKDQAAACSAATQAAKDATDRANVEKAKALAAKASALSALAADRKAQLAKPAQGGTCEQKLGRIAESLNEVAVREIRDRPPMPAEAADILNIPVPVAPARAPDPRRDHLRVQ